VKQGRCSPQRSPQINSFAFNGAGRVRGEEYTSILIIPEQKNNFVVSFCDLSELCGEI